MKNKIDYDSSVNQNIKGQFVAREVKACFSYEMDAILGVSQEHAIKDLPTFEDIENYDIPTCEECGETNNDGEHGGGLECYCEVCKKNTPWNYQAQEIFEWWIVTDYLYRKLRAHGEPVLEWGNNCYWGRCTTGQSISLDWVISKICEEMEILSGQKYSWKEK